MAEDKAKEIGAEQKAVIFSESRRTQSHLLRVLADSPFRDDIVPCNGSNTDDGSRMIDNQWLERHQGSDRVADDGSHAQAGGTEVDVARCAVSPAPTCWDTAEARLGGLAAVKLAMSFKKGSGSLCVSDG